MHFVELKTRYWVTKMGKYTGQVNTFPALNFYLVVICCVHPQGWKMVEPNHWSDQEVDWTDDLIRRFCHWSNKSGAGWSRQLNKNGGWGHCSERDGGWPSGKAGFGWLEPTILYGVSTTDRTISMVAGIIERARWWIGPPCESIGGRNPWTRSPLFSCVWVCDVASGSPGRDADQCVSVWAWHLFNLYFVGLWGGWTLTVPIVGLVDGPIPRV